MYLDPLRSGFGSRDGRGPDPGENSIKKISAYFLNGICGWAWTPWGVDLDPGIPGWEGSDPRENGAENPQ